MPFSKVPNEIIVRILGVAEAQDIRRFQQACRRFRDLVATSLYLQYLLELDMSGYVVPSVPRTDLSLAEMIDAIRGQRRGWRRTELSHPKSIPVKLETQWGEYSRKAAHFINGTFATGPISLDSEPRLQYGISFRQLPSFNRGTGPKSWHHVVSAWFLRYFVIQPEWDLLVLLEETVKEPASNALPGNSTSRTHCAKFKLHLRTMSTNQPHPAVSPVNAEIVIDIDGLMSIDSTWLPRLRTYGQIIATTFDSLDAVHILVYNWLTGQQIGHLTGDKADRKEEFGFFYILSEDFIVVPYFFELNTWRENRRNWPRPTTMGHLEVYQLSSIPHSRCVAQLILPNIRPSYMSFSVRFGNPSVPATASLRSQVPKIFERPPNDDWLRIYVTASDDDYNYSYGALLISSKAVMNIVAGLNYCQGRPVKIPWETWGRHAVWLNLPTEGSIYRDFLLGDRLAAFAEQGSYDFRVWDFNLQRIRARSADTEGTGALGLTHSDTETPSFLDSAFAESIHANSWTVTNFNLTEKIDTGFVDSPMMDEEHVVFGLTGDAGDSELATGPGLLVYTL